MAGPLGSLVMVVEVVVVVLATVAAVAVAVAVSAAAVVVAAAAAVVVVVVVVVVTFLLLSHQCIHTRHWGAADVDVSLVAFEEDSLDPRDAAASATTISKQKHLFHFTVQMVS